MFVSLSTSLLGAIQLCQGSRRSDTSAGACAASVRIRSVLHGAQGPTARRTSWLERARFRGAFSEIGGPSALRLAIRCSHELAIARATAAVIIGALGYGALQYHGWRLVASSTPHSGADVCLQLAFCVHPRARRRRTGAQNATETFNLRFFCNCRNPPNTPNRSRTPGMPLIRVVN